MSDLIQSFNQIRRDLRILVLGDLMLDRYTWGDAERVSPEAPVIVLRADDEEVRPGGAASVAYLLKHLDAQVCLAGLVGNDSDGHTLRALIRDEGINDQLVLTDPNRPTTAKHRFIGRASDRHPHQILRVDRESRAPLCESIEIELGNRLESAIGQFDAVLIADYVKGVCTESLLQRVITLAKANELPVLVDPGRINDFRRYQGATLLKPNRLEAELATGHSIAPKESSPSHLTSYKPNSTASINTSSGPLQMASELRESCKADCVIITLDCDGLVLVKSDSKHSIPTTPRKVYDITGAGDMVLATLGLCLAGGMDVVNAAHIANIAAGLEVERFGIATVIREEIAATLSRTAPRNDTRGGQNKHRSIRLLNRGATLSHTRNRRLESQKNNSLEKIVTRDQLVVLVEHYRSQGKRIVFTNGCFDLFHVGHMTYLQEAAALGEILIVAVNSDASVKRLKGLNRPIITERDRALLIAAMECVNHVVLFEDDTPISLLQAVRPDILIKGGTTNEIIGADFVQSYGGKVCRRGEVIGVSTTAIIKAATQALTLQEFK